MNAHSTPLLGEPTSLALTPRGDLVTGRGAGRDYGLGGNVLTFLRNHGHIEPAFDAIGRKPLYSRADCARCNDLIVSGAVVLTGSAREWRDWYDEQKRQDAAARAPEPEPVDAFEAVEMDFPASAEIIAALRPLAALANLIGADDKPAAFPLVLHRGLPVLTMNDAREARLLLRKIEGGLA